MTPSEARKALYAAMELVEPDAFSETLYCNVPKGRGDKYVQMHEMLVMDEEKLASGAFEIVMSAHLPVSGESLRWPGETFADAAFDIAAIAAMTAVNKDVISNEMSVKLNRAIRSLRATKYNNPNVDLIKEVVDWARKEEGFKAEKLHTKPRVDRGISFTREREALDAPIYFREIWGGAGKVIAVSKSGFIDNEQKLKDGSWLDKMYVTSLYTLPDKRDKESISGKYLVKRPRP